MEMMSQIIFTLLGLALLIPALHEPRIVPWAIGGIGLAVVIVAAFISAQRFGLFHLVERGLIRLAERGSAWSSLGEISGLHPSITALYASPRRLVWACGYHLLSWLLGGVQGTRAPPLVGPSVS